MIQSDLLRVISQDLRPLYLNNFSNILDAEEKPDGLLYSVLCWYTIVTETGMTVNEHNT